METSINAWRFNFLLQPSINARVTFGRCTLAVEGDFFIMTTLEGAFHRLAIDCTDVARLGAHWRGFCERHA
jgi:hypothetical protein